MKIRNELTAANQEHLDKLVANGCDLVIVQTSGRCCEYCAAYDGKVLSITGRTPGYDTVDNALVNGFQHPGCSCVFGLYLEGYTEPRAEQNDPQAYKDRQTQLYNEGMIRLWKRRQAAAITPEAKQLSSEKVKEWQEIQRAHIKAANLAGEKRHGKGWLTLRRNYSREG